MDELKPFSGAKSLFGGGGGGAKPDTLKATDVVEAIFGICEGEIKGLENGARSFFIGDTPLVNSDGKGNFENIQLKIWKGAATGTDVKPLLGGFATSSTVNTTLSSNTSVVRTGLRTNIDYIDIRLLVQRLVFTKDGEERETDFRFKIEYKPTSSTTWQFAFPNTTVASSEVGAGFNLFRVLDAVSNQDPLFDAACFWQPTTQNPQPTPAAGTYWFQTNNNNRPKITVSGAWVDPPGLTLNNTATPNYWYWTENGTLRRAFFGNDTVRPTDLGIADFWLKANGVQTGSQEVYVYNGSAWQASKNYNLISNPLTGEIQLRGKSSGGYPKEIRFAVPKINETYDIRVTKTSPNNTTEYFCDVQWESFQEIEAKTYSFNNTAVAQFIGRASDQFSNLPDFSGVYEGRIIRVPVNYDPVARTYTGVWNGSYKLEYTDNPGAVVLDLVENDRYGMNAYYPVTMDKWAVYAFMQHCDNYGFRFNGLIQEPKSCREMIDFICGMAGAKFIDDGNGYATILIDAVTDPVMLFTPENVVDGLFTYSMTEVTSRYNDIIVSFTNPTLNWAQDRRRITDAAHQAIYGKIPYNFEAIGCISAEEAIRRARLQLITATTETIMVTFKTNRRGLYLAPYEVILVADDTSGFGLHGRIKTQDTPTQVTLRDPVYLEPGFTYKAKFEMVNGNKYEIVERTITGASGTRTTLTWTGDLTLPEEAVFSLESSGSSGTPKAYRVITIDENEGDPDNVSVSAIEVNRLKWDYVSGAITLPSVDVYGVNIGVVEPVTNVRITPVNR